MERNWERSVKVFNDRLVFGNGPVYLRGLTFLLIYRAGFHSLVSSPTTTEQIFMFVRRFQLYYQFCRLACGGPFRYVKLNRKHWNPHYWNWKVNECQCQNPSDNSATKVVNNGQTAQYSICWSEYVWTRNQNWMTLKNWAFNCTMRSSITWLDLHP